MKIIERHYLDKVKICGIDVNKKKFVINTNVKWAKHYNTANANYWQRVVNYFDNGTKREQWKLMFQS